MRFFFLIHTKARILNKKALFYHFFHKKIWNFQGEDLSLQRVFIVLDLRLTRLGYSGIPFFLLFLLLEGDKISVFYEVSHELSQLLYVVPHTLGVCSISPHNALSFSLTSLYYFVALTPFVFAMDNYTSAAPKTTPR